MTLRALIVAFFATCALDWPPWPFGIRLPDLIFPALAAAVLLGSKERRFGLAWVDWLVLLYIAGSLPSMVATSNARASGTELLIQLYLATVYAITVTLARRGYCAIVARALAGGVFVLALVGVLAAVVNAIFPAQVALLGETMVVPYAGEVFRIRALTSSPAMLVCALMAAVPLAIALARSGAVEPVQRQQWWWLGLGVAMVAAVMTFSHAVSGLAVALTIASWPVLTRTPRLRMLMAIGSVMLVVAANATLVASIRSVGAGGVQVNDVDEYHHGVDSGEWQAGDVVVRYELMGYLRLKQIALDAFAERPVTGAGLNTFHGLTASAFREGQLPAVFSASDPHSTLLGRLAETGLPGGITLIALWAGVLTIAMRLMNQNVWLGRALLAALVAVIVTSINVDIMNFRFVWVLFGLVSGLQRLHDVPAAPSPRASSASVR
jgi:hypothetical protein